MRQGCAVTRAALSLSFGRRAEHQSVGGCLSKKVTSGSNTKRISVTDARIKASNCRSIEDTGPVRLLVEQF